MHSSAITWLDAKPPSSNIGVLTDAEELRQLYRQRYQRYVVEQGKPYAPWPGTTDQLVDPCDAFSLNLAQRIGGRIGASMRLTLPQCVVDGEYLQPLRDYARRQLHDPAIIVSRMMVPAANLNMRAMVGVCQFAYILATHNDIRYFVISSRPSLVKIWGGFGYRETGIVFESPVSGPQAILTMDIWDLHYLAEMNSSISTMLLKLAGRLQSDRGRSSAGSPPGPL